MNYPFYSSEKLTNISPIDKNLNNKFSNPYSLYVYFLDSWSIETCTPRMRNKWSNKNKTIGQCSITSFIVQDIFGGEVYGVPLDDGNFHCFNVIGNIKFDLTSEQFDKKLIYTKKYPQSRTQHFLSVDKFNRYKLLKEILFSK